MQAKIRWNNHLGWLPDVFDGIARRNSRQNDFGVAFQIHEVYINLILKLFTVW